jgi:hypothetical protein
VSAAAGPLHPPSHSRSYHRYMNRVVLRTACGAALNISALSAKDGAIFDKSSLLSGDKRSPHTWTTRGTHTYFEGAEFWGVNYSALD